MKLADIYMQFQSDITIIEQELEASVQARHDVLKNASTHLLKAGGKRIRPVFVLLAAKFGTYDIHVLKNIAVPLELVHMASLVHDDVIDDAELRRGKRTVKSQWDNKVAMYTGNYIFAKAVEASAYFDHPRVHQVLSNTLVEMCIGEVEQIRDQYNWGQNLRVYLRRIKRKTALLIAVSCELGALAADADPVIQKHLYNFGYNVGMSFQITDDILDFVGTEKQLGKPAGGDLRQGNVTLPALYAMHHDEEISHLIKNMLKNEFPENIDMQPILKAVKESGGIDYSIKMSDRFLHRAYDSLERLPDCEAKNYLKEIAAYIGKRKF
ncbi:heptaprenyl diphosphate synthase component II (spore germination protein C3) [Alkalihalophilus pseudofirmus OF4]|uniref:Heptaprenyl diphosphate synthase component 2 n=1 Tax=Alkalihalophilus pseudofirmus (strain ATCC BAA-2126 / JCM 17055 / OF4) TaxID=398511 RepID=D3G048_ALKPO|nr:MULTISPECIES: heptaprenyl diphosphate synthase component II [Alkalihalophilus]ADC51133.1 heptaprenyl diphosphate synthase component II (spore germination protein C3) [Alkalihalophilus pseudofirmus OF4]MED1601504.1 heptaprenyl diphosphate synthase component II [Alkalihalophilus marmarensis]